ncbi:MAG: DNA-directed RNA polymerase subunit A' [Euryarchaeota archaeon]|nr:DNA-directed RNA polymerase subunit A' [Euryarchaeota archaeon]|tara:strand:- start:6615 stop:9176 length:2562 start_codon:yes stop_codon:yes gene_type:complete
MNKFIKSKIDSIEFRMLSPKMIKRMSVAKIITPDTHDTDGYPIKSGLMDPRLGVIDPGLRCRTCKSKMGECPGHFGFIDLARPVIHVGFAKLIYNVLRGTCRPCGRILLPQSDIDDYKIKLREAKAVGAEEFEDMVKKTTTEARKPKACAHCSEKKLKIKFEKPTGYTEDGARIMPTEIKEWFEKIPDDDIFLFGLKPESSRPEWAILTVVPVPPVTTRPSITLETGERSEDDLTHKLVDIIRLNQRLRENIEAGAPHLIVEDQWELVQYHVTTLMDNEVTGVPTARHRSGRPLKTLKQRLKGKEGRFRSSLAGKRVDFSARTVVSPDPNISIDEVGIPYEIATELTIPERITTLNKERILTYVKNRDVYPGANYVIRPDGRRKRLTSESIDEILEEIDVGYIVERHLIDGDIVLFNRQPSLHKMSMMAHRARILPGKTFRLNLCVCTPYNADFDGDEMNLHVPQTEEARTEARLLMSVQNQIRSPRFGGPIIGCIHDHISGLYSLSKDELNSKEAFQLASRAGYAEEFKLGTGRIQGRDIISLFIPDDINMEYTAKDNGLVVIKNGILKKGSIDDKSVGVMAGKLLDEVLRKHGPEGAKNFLNSITKLAIAYLDKRGFTTGLDEEDLPEKTMEDISKVLSGAEKKVDELVSKYRAGKLVPSKGKSVIDTLEELIMIELNNARNKAGTLAKDHLEENNFALLMAKTGARGSMLNITQMSACIGQQAIRGQRILRGYRERTLPHFAKNDLGARSRGFVSSSYKSGMGPIEFFFHAMGGRESLTDTAMRTPKSGYLQRRLINAMQDIIVDYNETVRDGRGVIIQFNYGEDGVDPAKTDLGKSVNLEKTMKDVENK